MTSTPGARFAGITLMLVIYLALLLAQRIAELLLSARHTRTLRAFGAREFGKRQFPWFVALHTLYPVALAAEVVALGAHPGAAWRAWLGLWVLAQGLRVWAMRTLGTFWNVRVWVLPGAIRVRGGPYRFLPHPNYLAVAIELIAAPMIFGAWRTALVFSVLNALLLAARIRTEERALR